MAYDTNLFYALNRARPRNNDSHEASLYDWQQMAYDKGIRTQADADAWGYNPNEPSGDLYQQKVGASIPWQQYLQQTAGGGQKLFQETANMTPEQFVASPYSQYQRNPDGSVTNMGTSRPGWQNPTLIDQDPRSFKDFLKTAAPLAAAGIGLPYLMSGMFPAGAAAGAAGAGGGIGSGIAPTLAELSGGTLTDFSMGAAANAGDLAALGEFGSGAPWWEAAGSGAADASALAAEDAYMGQFMGQGLGSGTMAGQGAAVGGLPLWAQTPTSPLSQLLKKAGIDIDPDTLGLAGTALSTGLGLYGANKQANAMQDIAQQARTDVNANNAQMRSDRAPFLAQATQMLQNPQQDAFMQNAMAMLNAPRSNAFLDDALAMMRDPNSFYQRPEVTGAIDASLRGLSAQVGKPHTTQGFTTRRYRIELAWGLPSLDRMMRP
jgi:hypothetical protein